MHPWQRPGRLAGILELPRLVQANLAAHASAGRSKPGPLQRGSLGDGVDRQMGSTGSPTESPPKDRAFLSAFDRALRSRDSAACLQLVRSLACPGQPTGASQAFLGALLRGRHQALMRQLIADGDVEGALDYLAMLPPSGHLDSALLKACMDTGDLVGLKRIVQASQPQPVPMQGIIYGV